MADLDPSNRDQLGEFMYREWCEATRSRVPDGGYTNPQIRAAWQASFCKWSELHEVDRCIWRDVAAATYQRFAGEAASPRGSVLEQGA